MYNTNINYVSNMDEVRSTNAFYNSTMLYMDKDEDRFYISECDNFGNRKLRVFEFTEVTPTVATSSGEEYVRRDELEAMFQKYMHPQSHEIVETTFGDTSKMYRNKEDNANE